MAKATNQWCSLLSLATLCAVSACVGDEEGIEDGAADASGGKADAVVMTAVEMAAVLTLVNDPAVDRVELRDEAGLSNRVAGNITAHRDGADATVGTADDDGYDDLDELDAIPYVGANTLKALLRYARALGLVDDGGSCGAQTWKRSIVYHSQGTSSDLAIGVTPQGRPRLAYADVEGTPADRSGRLRTSVLLANGSWHTQILDEQDEFLSVTLAVDPSGTATVCSLAVENQGTETQVQFAECRKGSASNVWRTPLTIGPHQNEDTQIVTLGKLSLGTDGGLLLPYAVQTWTIVQNYRVDTVESRLGYRAPGETAFSDDLTLLTRAEGGNSSYTPVMSAAFDRDGGIRFLVNGGLYSSPGPYQDYVGPANAPASSQRPHHAFDEIAIDSDGILWATQGGNPLSVFEQRVDVPPYNERIQWREERPGLRASDNSFDPALAFDSHGRLHVVAGGFDGKPVHAIRQSDGHWDVERIDNETGAATHPALAIDAQDVVHVTYWDESLGNVIYAKRCAL